jgi:hypothetical protein
MLGVPPVQRLVAQRDALLSERNMLKASLILAEDRRHLMENSPFLHYNAMFDPKEVVQRHAVPNVQPTPGYLTNFLGVKLDPKYFPNILNGKAGQVEAVPIPGNWHADLAEWGAALRAVDLARESFTMVELGCGWGCWMNNTGTAARRAGLNVHLIGIEGDAGHIAFAEEARAVNGFAPEQVTLHHGVAASKNGVALFPRQEQPGIHWGLEPVFGASEAQRQQATEAGTHDALPMLALADVLAPYPRIDLLHIDIQGGEADLIAGCLAVLNSKVAYIVVGTHSRPIEGRIIDTLLAVGWNLEIERPAILSVAGKPIVTVDGVQGWRNPRLDYPPNG